MFELKRKAVGTGSLLTSGIHVLQSLSSPLTLILLLTYLISISNNADCKV